ncbi:hypothetical protein [Nostoc sp.]
MSLPLNQNVLVESPSLRTSALSNLDDSRAQEVLSKAKAIVFAVWNGSGWATTAQIAEYFSVTESAVKELTRVNQSEFQTQETKTLIQQGFSPVHLEPGKPWSSKHPYYFCKLGRPITCSLLNQ